MEIAADDDCYDDGDEGDDGGCGDPDEDPECNTSNRAALPSLSVTLSLPLSSQTSLSLSLALSLSLFRDGGSVGMTPLLSFSSSLLLLDTSHASLARWVSELSR